MPPAVERIVLETPPLPCLVPAGVFDDFAWCESDRLEWRRPAGRWSDAAPLDGSDPERMVFVLYREVDFLPLEHACLHAFGLGLEGEKCLAPYGIDDATDGLHQQRQRPRELFWLAADNLNALFWGLHDWAHFHNHGPFEARAWTELQCDSSALAWIWRNRAAIGIADSRWEQLRRDAEELGRGRFSGEGLAMPEGAMERERLIALAERG